MKDLREAISDVDVAAIIKIRKEYYGNKGFISLTNHR